MAVIHYMLNLATTLMLLEEVGLIFHDLHPGNIMMSSISNYQLFPVVIDFASVTYVGKTNAYIELSRYYTCKQELEDMLNRNYGKYTQEMFQRSYIFNLGLIFYELWCGKQIPWFGENSVSESEARGILDDINNSEVENVIRPCLLPIADRPSITQFVDSLQTLLCLLSANAEKGGWFVTNQTLYYPSFPSIPTVIAKFKNIIID